MHIIANPGGRASGQIYNIGNPGNDLSVRELAVLMLEIAQEIPEYRAGAAAVTNSVTINTAGTLTVTGAVAYNTGTLTYTAGTVSGTGSTLTIGANTTLNTNGMSWNSVTLNGASRGTTPCDIERIPSGTVELDISLKGFAPYHDRLVVKAGDVLDVQAPLKAVPAAPLTPETTPE